MWFETTDEDTKEDMLVWLPGKDIILRGNNILMRETLKNRGVPAEERKQVRISFDDEDQARDCYWRIREQLIESGQVIPSPGTEDEKKKWLEKINKKMGVSDE